MHVVGNTSPLLNLAVIEQADLLQKLFGTVTAPEVVRSEIDSLSHRNPRFSSVSIVSIATFVPVQDRARVALLSLHLDPGEAEAIALAVETNADLLLLDERLATRTAQRLGLKTLGLLGVLLLAKRKRYLTEIRPVLDRLESEAGFWIGDRLRRKVLHLASE
jgi:predicted nucleic acid-binding protein